MSPPQRVASLLRLSVVLGGLSKHYLAPPPGTVDARCMMCHTTPPEGTEPLRHSITRSSSALSRSAHSSHDRPASSLSRSPKSFGKSSG